MSARGTRFIIAVCLEWVCMEGYKLLNQLASEAYKQGVFFCACVTEKSVQWSDAQNLRWICGQVMEGCVFGTRKR